MVRLSSLPLLRFVRPCLNLLCSAWPEPDVPCFALPDMDSQCQARASPIFHALRNQTSLGLATAYPAMLDTAQNRLATPRVVSLHRPNLPGLTQPSRTMYSLP